MRAQSDQFVHLDLVMSKPDLDVLTGLRGICAVAIVVGHSLTNFIPTGAKDWPTFCVEYFQAVTLFFLLSGFTLTVIYPARESTRANRCDFWSKRFARVAPAYWFGLLLALPPAIIYSTGASDLIPSLVLSPLFLQSLTLVGNDWSGPMWQISAFALCYLMFPFLSHRLTKATSTQLICLALVLYLIPLIVMIVFVACDLPALGTLHTWAPVRFPQFMIGAILGEILRREPPRPSVVILELCTLAMATTFAVCAIIGHLYGPGAWWHFMLVTEFAAVPLHCLWIYALAFNQSKWSPTRTFFRASLVQDLGKISYSFYVVHWPLLFFYTWLRCGGTPSMQTRDRQVKMGFDTLVEGLYALESWELWPMLSIVALVAIVAHRLVEEPLRVLLTPSKVQTAVNDGRPDKAALIT